MSSLQLETLTEARRLPMQLQHTNLVRVSRHRVLMQATPPPDGVEPDPSQGGGASTDWDTAWQREVAKRKQGQAEWRPEGLEPVSDQQLGGTPGEKIPNDAADAVQRLSG